MTDNTCIVCCKTIGNTRPGMCQECTATHDAGYIALVVVKDPPAQGRRTITPSKANRTGTVVHITREAFEEIFTVPVPEKGVVFVQPEMISYLATLAEAIVTFSKQDACLLTGEWKPR